MFGDQQLRWEWIVRPINLHFTWEPPISMPTSKSFITLNCATSNGPLNVYIVDPLANPLLFPSSPSHAVITTPLKSRRRDDTREKHVCSTSACSQRNDPFLVRPCFPLLPLLRGMGTNHYNMERGNRLFNHCDQRNCRRNMHHHRHIRHRLCCTCGRGVYPHLHHKRRWRRRRSRVCRQLCSFHLPRLPNQYPMLLHKLRGNRRVHDYQLRFSDRVAKSSPIRALL